MAGNWRRADGCGRRRAGSAVCRPRCCPQTAVRRCRPRATRTRAPSTAARGIAATTAAARSRLNVRFRSAGPSASVCPVTTTRRRTPAWRAATSSCRSSATIAPSASSWPGTRSGVPRTNCTIAASSRRLAPRSSAFWMPERSSWRTPGSVRAQQRRLAHPRRRGFAAGHQRVLAHRQRHAGRRLQHGHGAGHGHPRVERLIQRPASFDPVRRKSRGRRQTTPDRPPAGRAGPRRRSARPVVRR